jgi:DNA polymerase-4
MFSQIIAHIDFNSYFASCEQQDRPEWRDKPLGVCEHLGGIIIAASVEAKRWGIKTGTPVWEARKLYPKIILTPTTPDRYRHYTGKFLKVLGDYTDDIDKYSIDEAFVYITEACNIKVRQGVTGWKWIDPFEEGRRMALEIKRRITAEVGDYLRVSIGVGWNKFVAKIASDMQKPDGLVVVRPSDKPMLYEKLQLTDLPGIAKRQERNLNALGIKTVADLRDYPEMNLVTHFGIMGYHLHRMGQLEGSWKETFDDDPIKSMGHMYTLPMQYRNKPVLKPVLYKLSEMVAARLRANDLMGDHIHAHVHDADYNCYGQGRKLGYSVMDGRDIYLEAARIVDKQLPAGSPVKLIGVTVSGLTELVHQQSLFPPVEKRRRIAGALDIINEKYDDFTITRVPAFLARDIIRDSVGFGRMKEFKSLGRFVGVH